MIGYLSSQDAGFGNIANLYRLFSSTESTNVTSTQLITIGGVGSVTFVGNWLTKPLTENLDIQSDTGTLKLYVNKNSETLDDVNLIIKISYINNDYNNTDEQNIVTVNHTVDTSFLSTTSVALLEIPVQYSSVTVPAGKRLLLSIDATGTNVSTLNPLNVYIDSTSTQSSFDFASIVPPIANEPNLPRETLPSIFSSKEDGSPNSEVWQFGSAASGNPTVAITYQQVFQFIQRYKQGWFGAVVANDGTTALPAMQDTNATIYALSYQVFYSLQKGIPEYDVGTTYYKDSMCKVGNKLYYSLKDNNSGNDPTVSTLSWAVFGAEEITSILQQGIVEWRPDINYGLFGLSTGSNGVLYQSLIADNLGNDPVTDAINWKQTIQSSQIAISSGVDIYSNFQITWANGATSFEIGALQLTFKSLSITTPSVNPTRDYAPQTVQLSTCPVTQTGISIWWVTYSYNELNPSVPTIGWVQTPVWGGIGEDQVPLVRVIVTNNAGVKTIATGTSGSGATAVTRMPWLNSSSINAKANNPVMEAGAYAPSPNLTLGITGGKLTFDGINYGQPNPLSRTLSSSTSISFIRISPAINSALVIPALSTTVDPTQYWNGTALAPVPNNTSSVQRLLLTTSGTFILQYGETTYSSLQAGIDAVYQAPFTDLQLSGSAIQEVCRLVVLGNATNLQNTSQAAIYYPRGGSSSSSGSSSIIDHNSGTTGKNGSSPWFHLPAPGSSQYPRCVRVNSTGTDYAVEPRTVVVLTNLFNSNVANSPISSNVTYQYNNGDPSTGGQIPNGGNAWYSITWSARHDFGSSFGLDNYVLTATSASPSVNKIFTAKKQSNDSNIYWTQVYPSLSATNFIPVQPNNVIYYGSALNLGNVASGYQAGTTLQVLTMLEYGAGSGMMGITVGYNVTFINTTPVVGNFTLKVSQDSQFASTNSIVKVNSDGTITCKGFQINGTISSTVIMFITGYWA